LSYEGLIKNPYEDATIDHQWAKQRNRPRNEIWINTFLDVT